MTAVERGEDLPLGPGSAQGPGWKELKVFWNS